MRLHAIQAGHYTYLRIGKRGGDGGQVSRIYFDIAIIDDPNRMARVTGQFFENADFAVERRSRFRR